VSGLVVNMPEGGEWVSDYELLLEKWEHGWDMRALNYCVDTTEGETGRFKSMQIVLGHEDVNGDEEYRLQRHGGAGGPCYQWKLEDHDFIVKAQYQFDWITGYVDMVQFVTAKGVTKQIGSGTGPLVTYHYSQEKQFTGIISYEIDDETYAFGAFDSVCNHLDKDDYASPESSQEGAREPDWDATSVKGEEKSATEKAKEDTKLTQDVDDEGRVASLAQPADVKMITIDEAALLQQ